MSSLRDIAAWDGPGGNAVDDHRYVRRTRDPRLARAERQPALRRAHPPSVSELVWWDARPAARTRIRAVARRGDDPRGPARHALPQRSRAPLATGRALRALVRRRRRRVRRALRRRQSAWREPCRHVPRSPSRASCMQASLRRLWHRAARLLQAHPRHLRRRAGGSGSGRPRALRPPLAATPRGVWRDAR